MRSKGNLSSCNENNSNNKTLLTVFDLISEHARISEPPLFLFFFEFFFEFNFFFEFFFFKSFFGEILSSLGL